MTDQYLEPRQSGPAPTAYERKLAGAVEEVFLTGLHELGELVEGLNDLGVLSPDGKPWTKQTLAAELHRLGA